EAAEGGLVSLVHGAHAAGADLLDDVVRAEPAARLDGHESASTLYASTLALRPFRSSAPSAVARTPSPAACRRAAEQITSPAFACDCKRAATLTVSPIAVKFWYCSLPR